MAHKEAITIITTVTISTSRKGATTAMEPTTCRPAKPIPTTNCKQAPMKIGIKTNPAKWISTGTEATIAPGTPMIRQTKRTTTTVDTATTKAGITTGNRGKQPLKPKTFLWLKTSKVVNGRTPARKSNIMQNNCLHSPTTVTRTQTRTLTVMTSPARTTTARAPLIQSERAP